MTLPNREHNAVPLNAGFVGAGFRGTARDKPSRVAAKLEDVGRVMT